MIKQIREQFCSRQFIIFLVTGSLAAAVNFLSRIYLSHYMTYPVAIVIAYLLGMVTAFTLFKVFVFESKQSRKVEREFFGFVVVNALGILQALIFSLVFVRVIFPSIGFAHHPEEVAHFIGISVPIFSSYIGHKYYSFKDGEGAGHDAS